MMLSSVISPKIWKSFFTPCTSCHWWKLAFKIFFKKNQKNMLYSEIAKNILAGFSLDHRASHTYQYAVL